MTLETDTFEKIKDERGMIANIHKAFDNIPEGVMGHYLFYKKIMLDDELPLTRVEREWLAVEVSELNKCPYCISHHKEALKFSLQDLDDNQKSILSRLSYYITREPWKTSHFKLEFCKEFSEAKWQHAVMIASYFNMANRMAFAMDLELEKDFFISCH